MRRLLQFALLLVLLAWCVPASAQITYVGAGALGATQTTTDATATAPSGTAAGDIALVYCWVRNTADTMDVAGYAEIPGTQVDTATGSHSWWWKRLTGPAATATCNKSASADSYARQFAFRGVVTSGNPWNAVNPGQSGTPNSSGIYTATGITTAAANSMVVVFSGYEDDDEASVVMTSTTPASYTTVYAESSTGNDGSISMGYAIRASAGATGTITIDYNTVAGSDAAGTLLLSLQPAPPPPPAAISFVNGCQQSTGSAAVTSRGCATTLTSGNFLWVGAEWNCTTGTPSVSDTLGHTFTPVPGTPRTWGTSSNSRMGAWYAESVAGGSDTITVSYGCSSGWDVMYTGQFAGVSHSTSMDQVNISEVPGAGNPVTSSTFTTGTADEVIINIASSEGTPSGTLNAGTGFRAFSNTDNSNVWEYRIVTSAGSYASSYANGATGRDVVMFTSTFKAVPIYTGPTYNISGTVGPLPAGAGVTVTVAGATSTTTDNSGIYSVGGLADGGTYTVTPSKAGTTFNPTSQSVTISGGNQTGIDFTAINPPPDLTITKTHSGSFAQGQTGATYTITATNSGGSSTSGTVTVTDTALPASLTPTALSGTGWTCTLATLICTRNDALAAGASYPAITLTVDVAANTPSSVTNTATVSGGGETNASNDTANDLTTVTAVGGALTHVGGAAGHPVVTNQAMTFNYTPVGTNNALVVLIGCRSPGITSMSLTAPGWTFAPISGLVGPSGFFDFISTFGAITPNKTPVTFTVTLTGGNGDCTSNDTTVLADEFSGADPTGGPTTFDAHNESLDPLASGICTGAPVIPANNNDALWYACFDNVTAVSNGYIKGQDDGTGDWSEYKILSGGAGTVQNPGFVTNPSFFSFALGGVSIKAAAVSTGPVPDLAISKTHSGSFIQGQTGAIYTITVTNSGGAATTSTITMTDTLPAGLTQTAISGTGWACTSATLICTRSNALAAGASYPAITLTVDVAANALSSVTNTATVSGGGETNTSNNTANDPTAVTAQTSGCANDIVCENAKPGTPSSTWQISGIGDSSIQGFATDISVNRGQTISFKIDTDASAYRLDIYRMGYYGGNGARKIATVNPSAALPQNQPACLTNSATKLYDCGNWAVSASWAVPADATSGIYFAHLVRTDTGGSSHVVFIVRNDASQSDILFQTSDSSWQAYNDYGGNSLYGTTASTWDAANRAYKVSYNRPFGTRNLEAITWVFGAEYPMVRWLESNGYDVTYFTDVDSDRNGSLIRNHKIFMSNSHDEYWSGGQRTNVEAARDLGVNLAFFSGNEVFWKTRWENSIDGSGTSYRTLVCYKETLAGAKIDPTSTWTGTWRDPRFSPPADGGRPENTLTGTINMVNGPNTDNNGLSIKVPAADGKMRFWRNTSIANLSSGTATLPQGTLGYEWDVADDNGSRPAGLVQLSTTTQNLTISYLLDYGAVYGAGTATHHLTLYRAPSGALVFGGGTVQWSWGLDNNHDNSFGFATPPPSTDMRQATVNLLADMGVQPATIQSGLLPATKSTDTTPPLSMITSPAAGSTLTLGNPVTITGTASDSGGGIIGGVEVSVNGGGTWHPANGRASWTYSFTPAQTGSYTLRSRAADDSGNIETPGPGVSVTVPGSTPDLTITKSHSGNFTQGQTGATYTILVTNGGGAATSGTVTVTDTALPASLARTAISGTGWTCTLATLVCTRSNALAAGASYPAITLTVNVAANAPSSVTNTATVSGGGQTNTSNDTASDLTTITSVATSPVLSVSPQNLPLTATVGGSNPPAATINVTNAGIGSLSFSASSDSTWLSVLPASGTAPQSLQATASVSGLSVGTYTGHITVTSTGTPGSPAVVTVTLSVGAISTSLASDATASGNRGTAAASVTTSPFSTTAGSELLLAMVGADVSTASGTNNSVTSITGGGLTWALVRRTNTERGTAEIWRAFATAPLTNATVTANLAINAVSSITVMSFRGVDTSGTNGSGAIGNTGAASGATGTLTASLVTLRDNSLVVGVGEDWNAAPSITAGPNQTIVHQVAYTNLNTFWTQRQNATTPLAGTTVTINETAPTDHQYNLTICEIMAPAGTSGSTYNISGTITPPAGGGGATVAMNGTATASTTTTGTGTYVLGGLVNGDYTITPSNTGYTFSPGNRAVTISGANATGVDFAAIPQGQTFSISGTVTSSGSGAVITLGGAASTTVVADNSGTYTITGLTGGTYSVTPSKAGFTFTPVSRNVTITTASVTAVNFTAAAFQSNFTVNGSQTFQTMDGTGVNINVNSWNNGELIPALDLLVDTNGAKVFRVIRDPLTWVNSESLIPALHNLDAATLQTVYEAPEMQEIWNTIGYLNQKGIHGNQVVLNFMGWTPTWLGGSGAFGSPSNITAGKEPALATMIASLVYYGRRVKNLDFTALAPMNEEDWDCKEGPCASSGQYVTILRNLVNELNFMGLTDVRIVAPDTALSPTSYISAVMADNTVAPRVDHLTYHTYGNSVTTGTAYSGKTYWVTETGASCPSCDTAGTPSQGEWTFARDTTQFVLDDIANGFTSVLVYDAYDSFYFHHNSFGFWGLLAYDQATGIYTPRKRFYTNAQVNAFISPGSVRIGQSDSISSLGTVVAFYNSTTGKVTIVGQNTGSSAVTINGQLLNLPAVSSLAVYTTNSSADLQRGTDVPVSAGTFTVTIPADTLFSLTN